MEILREGSTDPGSIPGGSGIASPGFLASRGARNIRFAHARRQEREPGDHENQPHPLKPKDPTEIGPDSGLGVFPEFYSRQNPLGTSNRPGRRRGPLETSFGGFAALKLAKRAGRNNPSFDQDLFLAPSPPREDKLLMTECRQVKQGKPTKTE